MNIRKLFNLDIYIDGLANCKYGTREGIQCFEVYDI